MNQQRTIYLIRHATPFEPGAPRRCLSRTELPLSPLGEHQAKLLGQWFAGKKVRAVFSSPRIRCVETANEIARALSLPVTVREGLEEMDAGLWENLTFDQIRRAYPKEYQARGENLGDYPIPGGESFRQAGERFFQCLMESILSTTEGDVAVIAHAGVIRACLCLLEGRPLDQVTRLPQPYGGITILRWGEQATVERTGWKPEAFLDEAGVEAMYAHFQTPEDVRRHMQAVADYAMEILDRHGGGGFHRERIYKAGLVHDIARTHKNHEVVGADFLDKEGYPQIGQLVRLHHSPEDPDPGTLSEADILFYADKVLQGTKLVTAKERFAASWKRCNTPQARENHQRRWEKTQRIERLLHENR